MAHVRVAIFASDPLTEAGLRGCLRERGELSVLDDPPPGDADVIVAAIDELNAPTLTMLRRWADTAGRPVVLLVRELSETDLLHVIERKVVAVVPRTAAPDERVVQAVLTAANGGGLLPPRLLGSLLRHFEKLHREVLAPRGLSSSGITPREADVLRLMAEGLDTAEIAEKLCYSQRTVKNVLHGLTNRLHLRNRAHAVAHALRADVI
ncbi:MAG: response regulator transcription factor [Thermocrispum agreste]|uniref:Response regulator transcription factor n=1 Tax=Thermocrispum agreste TaxID=37925 RepID=A0ABD6FGB1_9PSEU